MIDHEIPTLDQISKMTSEEKQSYAEKHGAYIPKPNRICNCGQNFMVWTMCITKEEADSVLDKYIPCPNCAESWCYEI